MVTACTLARFSVQRESARARPSVDDGRPLGLVHTWEEYAPVATARVLLRGVAFTVAVVVVVGSGARGATVHSRGLTELSLRRGTATTLPARTGAAN